MPPFSSLIVSRPLQSQAFPCAAFYNIFFSLLAWKSPFHSSGLSLNVTFSESFPNHSIKRKITPLHSLSYILGFFFFLKYVSDYAAQYTAEGLGRVPGQMHSPVCGWGIILCTCTAEVAHEVHSDKISEASLAIRLL